MLKLAPLTEQEIETHGIAHEKLWMVSYQGTTYGPFAQSDLSIYFIENTDVLNDSKVINLEESAWQPANTIKHFIHKEKPKLVDATNLKKVDEYWVVCEGQKDGPLNYQDVVNKLAEGSLKETDLLSDDKGLSWHKIYTLQEFFRPEDHCLPKMPPTLERPQGQEQVKQENYVEEAQKEVDESLIGLAFLETHSEEVVKNTPEKIENEHQASNYLRPLPKKWMAVCGASFAALMVLTWFLAPGDQSFESTIDKNQRVVKKKTPLKTKSLSPEQPKQRTLANSKNVKIQPRTINKPTRSTQARAQARRPASVPPKRLKARPSRAFRQENKFQESHRDLDYGRYPSEYDQEVPRDYPEREFEDMSEKPVNDYRQEELYPEDNPSIPQEDARYYEGDGQYPSDFDEVEIQEVSDF